MKKIEVLVEDDDYWKLFALKDKPWRYSIVGEEERAFGAPPEKVRVVELRMR